MKFGKQTAAWVMVTAAAMAVMAAPAHGQDIVRFPVFAARLDTNYAQVRELTASQLRQRVDPNVPGTVVAYGGDDRRYPLADAEMQTLAEGGEVRGVERLMAMDRLGDSVTLDDIGNEVVAKMGKMIRGWLFTVEVEGEHYHVFCFTDGKEVECKILTLIII